jgi:hypothetical protein
MNTMKNRLPASPKSPLHFRDIRRMVEVRGSLRKSRPFCRRQQNSLHGGTPRLFVPHPFAEAYP